MTQKKQNRRSVVKKMLAATAIGGTAATSAHATPQPEEKVIYGVDDASQEVPLFSSSLSHGNLVFVAGKGAHFKGDIKEHTKHVLDELEKELKKAGSSMDKVLKVNVYLHDLQDYDAMNEVYRGRFGAKPPVRTTVAVYGGVPGNSLVEIDCIAYK